MEKKKKKFWSKTSIMHAIKLGFRSSFFLTALIVYIIDKADGSFDFFSNEKLSTIVIFVFLGIYLIEMLLRFFPNDIESMGCQKIFRKNYVKPINEKEPYDYPKLKGVLLTLFIWLLLNSIFLNTLSILSLMVIYPKFRNKGYCFEAVKALCEKALNNELIIKKETIIINKNAIAIKESEKTKDLQERQRILYVGMTRPEEELYMFGIPAKNAKEFDAANWMDQLSRVYGDYPGVEKSSFSAADIELPLLENMNEEFSIKAEEEKLMEPIQSFNTSGRKLFTASALTNYLYCQRQYFYSEFMGLPALDEQVINETKDLSATTMGSIIHETLEKYNGRNNLIHAFKAAVNAWAPGANTDRAWKLLKDFNTE